MKSISVKLCVTLSILMAGLAQHASAIVIDDFSQGGVTLSDAVGGGSAADLKTGLDPAHTIGASRYVTFNALQIQSGATGQVTVQVDPAAGVLRYSPDTGLTAANFAVEYGNTSLGQPPISLDLLADGADRFRFDFDATQGQSFFIDFLANSANGASAYVYKQIPVSSAPFSFDITFAEILSNIPTLDLSHITRITFGTGNGNFRGTFALSSVSTVPEPSSFFLMSAALLTACIWVRLHRATV
jgi:hypothetical protein